MEENKEKIDSQKPPVVKKKKVSRISIFAEFISFLISQKKWWLLPIVLILLILGILIVVAAMNPATAPFIYTLF